METLAAYTKKLADSVLEPILARLLRQPLWVRGFALAVLLFGWFVGFDLGKAGEQTQRIRQSVAALTAPDTVELISTNSQEALRSYAAGLQDYVNDDLTAYPTETTAWTVAQALMAIRKPAPQDRANRAFVFLAEHRVPDCFCWPELNGRGRDNVVLSTSGWVLAAMARHGRPAGADDLRSVLAEQRADGWWPMFVDVSDTTAASTYATAWIVLGLIDQRERGFVDPAVRAEVDAAIARGVRWLVSNREAPSRWKPYPRLATAQISASISGLAVHVLHRARAPEAPEIARAWLDALPEPIPGPLDADRIHFEFPRKEGFHIDYFAQVLLPWTLMATVDAYPSGSMTQRARALEWIDAAVSSESLEKLHKAPTHWWHAELLIGLNHLDAAIAGHEPGGSGPE